MQTIEGLARFIASDDPTDWDRMGEPQREYWRRIAGRVVVWQAREKQARAEAAAAAAEEAEAA